MSQRLEVRKGAEYKQKRGKSKARLASDRETQKRVSRAEAKARGVAQGDGGEGTGAFAADPEGDAGISNGGAGYDNSGSEPGSKRIKIAAAKASCPNVASWSSGVGDWVRCPDQDCGKVYKGTSSGGFYTNHFGKGVHKGKGELTYQEPMVRPALQLSS